VSGRWQRLPWELRYVHGARLASQARRAAIVATHRHCRVVFEGDAHLGPGFALNIPGDGELVIGHGVDFRSRFKCEISGNGRVHIGAGSVFTSGGLVQCSTSIDIGEGAVFGQEVLIVDGSHRFRDHTRPMLEQGYDYRPITIGRHAAVMSKVTIAADIGEHAFIGANAVVLEPVPAYSLAVGVPARVIDYFGPSDRSRSPAPAQRTSPA
jgi:acetyltransferase-like isoleucine patch superfamily enzyme